MRPVDTVNTLIRERKYDAALESAMRALPRSRNAYLLSEAAYRAARSALAGALAGKFFTRADSRLDLARHYLTLLEDHVRAGTALKGYFTCSESFFELERLKLFKARLRLSSYRGDLARVESMEPVIKKKAALYADVYPEETIKILMITAIVFSKLPSAPKTGPVRYLEQIETILTEKRPVIKNPAKIETDIIRSRAFLHLKEKRFSKAYGEFKKLSTLSRDAKDRIFYLFACLYRRPGCKKRVRLRFLARIEKAVSLLDKPELYYLPYYTALFYKDLDDEKYKDLLLDAVARIEKVRIRQERDDDKVSYMASKIKVYEALIHYFIAGRSFVRAYYWIYRCKSRTFNEYLSREEYDDADLFLGAVRAKLSPGMIIADLFFLNGILYRSIITGTGIEIEKTDTTYEELNRRRGSLLDIISRAARTAKPVRKVLRTVFMKGISEVLTGILPEEKTACRELIIIPHLLLHNLPLYPLLASGRTCRLSVYASVYTFLRGPARAPLNPVCTFDNPGGDLLFTGIEREHLRTLFPRARSYTEKDCTRARFLKRLGERGILHFSGHSYFNHRTPLLSWLQMSDGQVSLGELRDTGTEIKKGIVFLSSCSSGMCRERPGDENISFPRYLLLNGTNGILYTLWELDDEKAPEFIKTFYAFLIKMKGEGNVQEAFNRTIRTYLESKESPEVYLAFNLVM